MMRLKPDTILTGATSQFGTSIPCLWESYCDPKVWHYTSYEGCFSGQGCYVVADSFEAALEQVYDAAPTVARAELHEAYGFDTDEQFQAALKTIEQDDGDWPELQEGYTYQARASGTGIVWHGYTEHLAEVTPAHLRALGHRLTIQKED